MDNVIVVYKPLGLTPLDAINAYRKKHPNVAEVKLGYAGRLDPMAEGVLVILVGDECNKRTSYERLAKEYQFELAVGITTDTYDALGLIQSINTSAFTNNFSVTIEQLIPSLTGTHTQPYPPYSAGRYNGKPLYWWARQNRFSEVIIPKKAVTITSIRQIDSHKTSLRSLKSQIIAKVNSVNGDFRQAEIEASWQNLSVHNYSSIYVYSLTIECSSGTYVRSIIHEIGQLIGVGAFALSIKRTRVGEYTLADAVYL